VGGRPWAWTGTAKYRSQASPLGEINRRPTESGVRGSSVQLFGTIARKGTSSSRALATLQAHATISNRPATVLRHSKRRTSLIPRKSELGSNRAHAKSFPRPQIYQRDESARPSGPLRRASPAVALFARPTKSPLQPVLQLYPTGVLRFRFPFNSTALGLDLRHPLVMLSLSLFKQGLRLRN
jgi:hypothetical protein